MKEEGDDRILRNTSFDGRTEEAEPGNENGEKEYRSRRQVQEPKG